MPLDRCLNFHNPTAGSWDSPSCPLIGQYWPLLWRHRSSKHAQLATPRSFLWYLCLFNSILLGRFVLRDKQLATKKSVHFDLFWPFLTFLWRHRSKNKVNIIVSCRVRRDLSNAVWIFTLRVLLLKIRRGALWATPSSGRVTRQTSSGRGLMKLMLTVLWNCVCYPALVTKLEFLYHFMSIYRELTNFWLGDDRYYHLSDSDDWRHSVLLPFVRQFCYYQ